MVLPAEHQRHAQRTHRHARLRRQEARLLLLRSHLRVPPVDVVPEDVVPMLPINPYGQTKLFGEWMARACEEPYGIRFCGLRYFNVAGCGPVELEDPAILNLIPMLFDRLKKGKAPAIFGDDYPTPDGTCVRDYIHVSDLADATSPP